MGHCDFLAGDDVPTMSSTAGEEYFHPPKRRSSVHALQDH
jgi:hypothetical protein